MCYGQYVVTGLRHNDPVEQLGVGQSFLVWCAPAKHWVEHLLALPCVNEVLRRLDGFRPARGVAVARGL